MPHTVQVKDGEAFAAEVVNAVMKGPAWEKTLLIWLYDEHGRYYFRTPPDLPAPAKPFARWPRASPAVVGWWLVHTDTDLVADARTAAVEALRWVADAAIETDGGASWPETRTDGAQTADDLYDGTAGVLMAFAEAQLSGVTGFGEPAAAAAGRLRWIAAAGQASLAAPLHIRIPAEPDSPVTSLYTGLAGAAIALATWAVATGDAPSAMSANALVAEIADVVTAGADSGVRDLIEGDAGTLIVLAELADEQVRPAASLLADRLVAGARWSDEGPDWTPRPDDEVLAPNFSHGSAGVAFALARAGTLLERSDLLEIAAAGGQRLVALGRRPDGTLAVPVRIPPKPGWPDVAYGWCHGSTGTVRLFQLLDRLQPAQGWGDAVTGCLAAIRSSGLPNRLYPGFWDNLGRCCGTAGVGDLALDVYQETSDGSWLDFADELARDVLSRQIADAAGVRWSNTEFRADPPELEPVVGLMQGAAGIAGWLLRLVRVHRDGQDARRIIWPDRP